MWSHAVTVYNAFFSKLYERRKLVYVFRNSIHHVPCTPLTTEFPDQHKPRDIKA